MKCPTKQQPHDSRTNCVESGHELRPNSNPRTSSHQTGGAPTKARAMMLVTASGGSIVSLRQLPFFCRMLNSRGSIWILRQHEKYITTGRKDTSFVRWLERSQHAGTTS